MSVSFTHYVMGNAPTTSHRGAQRLSVPAQRLAAIAVLAMTNELESAAVKPATSRNVDLHGSSPGKVNERSVAVHPSYASTVFIRWELSASALQGMYMYGIRRFQHEYRFLLIPPAILSVDLKVDPYLIRRIKRWNHFTSTAPATFGALTDGHDFRPASSGLLHICGDTRIAPSK